tara:strand:- start:89 stop:289 length:201 start_codon:yes stop_codon:yes gene_type:complete
MTVKTSTVSNVRFCNSLNNKKKSVSQSRQKIENWFKNKLLSKRFDAADNKILSVISALVTFYNKII